MQIVLVQGDMRRTQNWVRRIGMDEIGAALYSGREMLFVGCRGIMLIDKLLAWGSGFDWLHGMEYVVKGDRRDAGRSAVYPVAVGL